MYIISGRYDILDMEEEIVFGKLYKAKDLYENRLVFIQLIRDSKFVTENFLPNLIDESTMLGQINSPHIGKVFDVGIHHSDEECYIYIVNEYFSGIELDKVIRGNYMDLNSIVKITRKILRALGEAHRHNLYHGGLNESNILVDERYNIKIYDFCITKANKGVNIRKDNCVPFLSPHQLNINFTDKESDFFTLGVILFDAIFKRMPFGYSNNESEMLKLIDKGIDWNTVGVNNENIALVNIVKKLIRRTEKYENASEVLVDLSKFMYVKADIIDEVKNISNNEDEKEGNNSTIKNNNRLFQNIAIFVIALSTLAVAIMRF